MGVWNSTNFTNGLLHNFKIQISFFLLSIVCIVTGRHDPCRFNKFHKLESYVVRLDPVEIPDTLTTYVCYKALLPSRFDSQYGIYRYHHIVAFEPLVTNKDMVHHMILFGCPALKTMEYEGAFQLKPKRPHLCEAEDFSCRNFLVQWSKGMKGPICTPPDAGILINSFDISFFTLQIHFNNANYGNMSRADTSGFRIYYTTDLRENDIGNVQIGQNDLEIPPRQGHVAQRGGCSSECTKQWLSKPIFLTRVHLHTHKTGKGGRLEILRGGKVVREVIRDETYDFNHPPAHDLARPVKVLPGDELRVTCIYNTRDGLKKQNQTLYWGEGSEGEMCYAFISYYPKVKDFNQCLQFDHYDICTETGFSALGECVFQGFTRIFERGLAAEIIKRCTDPYSLFFWRAYRQLCSQECQNIIQDFLDRPCMQGRLGHHMRRVFLPTVRQWPDVRRLLQKFSDKC